MIIAMLSLLTPGVPLSYGQEAYKAVTAGNPEIAPEELGLMLTPLTMDELDMEVAAWMALLKAKAHDISKAEIEARQKNNEIKEAEAVVEVVEAAEEVVQAEAAAGAVEAVKEAKSGLLKDINALRMERTGIIDRLNVVLDALEKKGGEVELHRVYIAAVSGIRLDVSDTSAAWATVHGWATSEEGGVRWLLNLAKFLGTVFGFWIFAIVLGKAANKLLGASKNATVLMQDFMTTAVHRICIGIGIIVGLSALEVNIGPLLALIGAAGFVVAFALQDTLGSFASGIMILLYRPFDVGDLVDLAGVTGKVAKLNLVSVTIKTLDNKIVIIPNNAVWGNVITNATGSKERRVDMVFGIGYSDDMEKAQTLIENILETHPLVLKDPEPVVRVHELGDSSVNFVCRPWSKTDDYWTVYWDVTRGVKEAFDANDVSIPFPQRDVHLYQVANENPVAAHLASPPETQAHQAEDFPETGDNAAE
jgi:small conductance mechanosensitive channel